MDLPPKSLKRLLPRHPAGDPIVLGWDIAPRWHGLRRSRKPAAVATVVDVSLQGLLVEVPDDQDHQRGDVIEVSLGDVTGTVQVRHRRPGRDGHVDYGVVVRATGELPAALEQVVGAVRGDKARVDAAWHEAN